MEIQVKDVTAEYDLGLGNTGGLGVEFFYKAEQQGAASDAAGHPVFAQVEYVRIRFPGGKDVFEAPAAAPAAPGKSYAQIYAPHYKRFKEVGAGAGQAGFPVEQWPALNVAEAATLKALNVYTVEQLAEVSDETVERLGMGGRDLRTKAQAFLAAAKDSAITSKQAVELARLKEDNELQKMELEELRQMVKQLSDKEAKRK